MINFFHEEYADSLSIVSSDDTKQESLFVDIQNNKYINFDKKVLKKIYEIIDKGFCDTLSAVDTIIKEQDTIYFIEFKNQLKNQIKKYDIYSKAIESFALFQRYSPITNYKKVLIVISNDYDKTYKRLGRSLSLDNIPIEFQLC